MWEEIGYNVAIFLTVVTAGYGIVLIVLSLGGIAGNFFRNNSARPLLLNSIYLVNGLVNLGVGGVLFWLLEPSCLSTYSTIVIVSVFSLLDRFIRKYYSKRLEPNLKKE